MKNQPIIRKAQVSDLPAILRIENVSFGDDSFNRRQFAYLIKQAQGYFFVIEDGENVVGYISLLKHSRRSNLRIYSVAVDVSARGMHLGQRLLDKALETARMCRLSNVTLEVKTTNRVAMGLYEKNGFRVMGTIPDYYHDGSAAYYMKKEL